MSKNIELPNDLKYFSEQIGKNSMLVQGPGGNTSYKSNNQMWIKGSGTMLSDALKKDIFVLVDCKKVLSEINNVNKQGNSDHVIGFQRNLRPSIETSFHALISYPYVIHTHSINTIVHSISPQGRYSLETKLKGLNWISVPYKKPGEPLTRELQKYLINSPSKEDEGLIIILYNHGIIVAGQTIKIVEALVKNVEDRLLLEPMKRANKKAPLPKLPKNWQWVYDYEELSKKTKTVDILQNISLYPDHVVFLGHGLPKLSLKEFFENSAPLQSHKMLLIDKIGVILNISTSEAEKAMCKCLSDILIRLPEEWTVEGLSKENINELINWDAEKYRQKMAKKG